MILDGPLIELLVVIDGAKCFILLFDEKEGGSVRALQRLYISFG